MPLWRLEVTPHDDEELPLEDFLWTPDGAIREVARAAALLAEEYKASVTVKIQATDQWMFVCWWEEEPRQRIRWKAEDPMVLEECLTRHKGWREELCAR